MRTRRAVAAGVAHRGELAAHPARDEPALLLLDLVAVVVFAALGRRTHAEGISVAGVLGTAWPFAAGAVSGWGAVRAWRRPTSLGTGVAVWAATLALGMALRRATGEGTAAPFVVVAALVLAAFVLGWRAVVHLVRSRAERS
jgi:hypothetical protein